MDERDKDGNHVNLNLYGDDDTSPHRRLDLIFKPCKGIQLTQENKDRVNDECIYDLTSPAAVRRKL